MATPTKLTIVAFKNADFSGRVSQYTAQINPAKYDETHTVTYNKTGPMGGANATLKFNRMPPRQMTFELVFDATGVVTGSPKDLAAEIKTFKNVVYAYQGSIHSPYYLKVFWGKMSFGARLSAMTISYTLFKPNGAPLRAKANCTFDEFVDAKTLAKLENRQSPDVSHRVRVRAGDSLPLLCYGIYGSVDEMAMVARRNGLTSLRDLEVGAELVFPPKVNS